MLIFLQAAPHHYSLSSWLTGQDVRSVVPHHLQISVLPVHTLCICFCRVLLATRLLCSMRVLPASILTLTAFRLHFKVGFDGEQL